MKPICVAFRVLKVEEQKLQSQAIAAEEAAMKKVNKVKMEMRNQLQGFVDMQNKMEMCGMIVEAHAEDVDKVGGKFTVDSLNSVHLIIQYS